MQVGAQTSESMEPPSPPPSIHPAHNRPSSLTITPPQPSLGNFSIIVNPIESTSISCTHPLEVNASLKVLGTRASPSLAQPLLLGQKVLVPVKCPLHHLTMTYQEQFQHIRVFQEDHLHLMKMLWTPMVRFSRFLPWKIPMVISLRPTCYFFCSWTTFIWFSIWEDQGHPQKFQEFHWFLSQVDSVVPWNSGMHNDLQYYNHHPSMYDYKLISASSWLPSGAKNTNFAHCWR